MPQEYEQKFLDIHRIVKAPQSCPQCKELMRGPFTDFKMRDSALYFDLVRKYMHCDFCGTEVEVVDAQVIIDKLSSHLPPAAARAFNMKNYRIFERMPNKFVELMSVIIDEFQNEVRLPIDNLLCAESKYGDGRSPECTCNNCIHSLMNSVDSP